LFFFLFLVTLWQLCCMVKTIVVFGGLLSFFSCCYYNINVFSNYGCVRVGQHFILFFHDSVICKYYFIYLFCFLQNLLFINVTCRWTNFQEFYDELSQNHVIHELSSNQPNLFFNFEAFGFGLITLCTPSPCNYVNDSFLMVWWWISYLFIIA